MDGLLKNGAEVYAVAYFGAILVVALVEWMRPRRAATDLVRMRWFGNFSLTILGAAVVRLVFPIAGVGWAIFCRDRGFGLLNHVAWPAWFTFPLTIVVIDFSHYLQHYVLHRVPAFWRMHRTHHTDVEYDFSTGVRFHPFETVFATLVLMAVLTALGAPPAAVLISQALTVIADFVEHANVHIPRTVDRTLRLVFVTPDMHRVHHSREGREGNSNFSNMLSIWDRLFGTYVDQPAAGHERIAFGVREFTDAKHQRLHWMLVQPFLHDRDAGATDPPVAAASTEPAPQTARGSVPALFHPDEPPSTSSSAGSHPRNAASAPR
jgi:sterol desaturase/sphingolipid hydroxylase (fatty acid hydroxylase superfamily)